MSKQDEATRSQEVVISIEAPPDRIWKALTDPADLVNWFPLEAEVVPGEGGSILLSWGPGISGRNRIIAWDPPRHLRTSWMEQDEGKREPSAIHDLYTQDKEAARRIAVDYAIEGEGGRTTLRLVHSGFGTGARWDKEYEGVGRGWRFELRSLRHYLERHEGAARRAFWVRQPVDLDPDRTWSRLTGRNGLLAEGSIESLREGDRYGLTTASGDRLEGIVQIVDPPYEFAGTVENIGDGLCRFGREDCGSGPEAHVWLSTWNRPEGETEALRVRLSSLLASIFRG